MACLTRGACATGVSDLHFEAVGPTVPCPVPGWFFSGPMGWVRALFSGRLAGGCWRARRRSLIGHHRGEFALDILDGLGEGGVGRDEVVYGGVLLDGCVGEVVQRCGHLLCLFEFRGLVGSEGGVSGCHEGRCRASWQMQPSSGSSSLPM